MNFNPDDWEGVPQSLNNISLMPAEKELFQQAWIWVAT
jgi:hypothetical protein